MNTGKFCDPSTANPPCPKRGPDTTFTARGITISANGNVNGIVWTAQVNLCPDFPCRVPPTKPVPDTTAVLRAYDATDVSRRLYASDENTKPQDEGTGMKYALPMVANGKVYLSTVGDERLCEWPFDSMEGCGRLNVYGLIHR